MSQRIIVLRETAPFCGAVIYLQGSLLKQSSAKKTDPWLLNTAAV
jgi:hypothetical protein